MTTAQTDFNKYQIMPPLTAEERAELKEDIREKGVLVPIEIDEEGSIIDGHHRVELWNELRTEGHAVPMYDSVVLGALSEQEKYSYVIALNLKRRHLSKEAKAALFVQLRQQGWAFKTIAEAAGVSVGTVFSHTKDAMANPDIASAMPDYMLAKDGRMIPTNYAPRMTITGKAVERADRQEKLEYQKAPVESMATAWIIVINCESPDQQMQLMQRFTEEGLECRPMSQ